MNDSETKDRGAKSTCLLLKSQIEIMKDIFEKLDKDICASCSNRIFLECQTVPVAAPVLKAQEPTDTAEEQPAQAAPGPKDTRKKASKKKTKKKKASAVKKKKGKSDRSLGDEPASGRN